MASCAVVSRSPVRTLQTEGWCRQGVHSAHVLLPPAGTRGPQGGLTVPPHTRVVDSRGAPGEPSGTSAIVPSLPVVEGRLQIFLSVKFHLHLHPFPPSSSLLAPQSSQEVLVVQSLTPQLPPLSGSHQPFSLLDTGPCRFGCPVCFASCHWAGWVLAHVAASLERPVLLGCTRSRSTT